MLVTPQNIAELKANEVFVFGSNIDGRHVGGAARLAYDKFGAEWGVGFGPTGSCYAIPTMFARPEDIKPYVRDFIIYTTQHAGKTFLVTEIGCGIAGFVPAQIAPMFRDALYSANIALPQRFIDVIITYR